MWQMDPQLQEAVKCFWQVRNKKNGEQEVEAAPEFVGSRKNVVGGKHCDGFITLLAKLLRDAGLANAEIHYGRGQGILPGYFRPTKDWDLVVVADGSLLATIEVKSQIGSLGNNSNNRAEEAVGNGYDFQCAYKYGAFKPSAAPWLGYFILVEDSDKARRVVGVDEPYFNVFPEFKQCSYQDRYRLLCKRLVRERIYDAACFIVSNPEQGPVDGSYREPCEELGYFNFKTTLTSKAAAFAKTRQQLFPPKA